MSGVPRREPVFTEWGGEKSSPEPAPSPAELHEHTVRSPRATPWLGLALAALILAAPSVSPGSIASRLAASEASASSAPKFLPRLADQDEVQFSAFSVKLAGGSSADDLWRRWNDLRQRQLGLLDELTPAVKPAAGAGSGYVLLAGEFRNAAVAAEACGALRARFLACDVTHRSGAGLDRRS